MSAHPFRPGTPEQAFIADPRLAGAPLSVDAVSCLTNRMRAVVELLQSDGDTDRPGFTLHHRTILNALWLLSGLLEQLEALTMAACAGELPPEVTP